MIRSRRQFLGQCAAGLATCTLAQEPRLGLQLWGIAELWQWLYQRQQSSGQDSADCLQAHLDQGIRQVIWALGRSTLDYQSALPTSTLYRGDTREETRVIGQSFERECSLRAAVQFANRHAMTLYARLGMNRHYGDALGGKLRSSYIAAHPEWMERHRHGAVDGTKVCFAVPEYRAERIAVLLEAASLGAHGLCLDFCRQPPHLRYHPLLLDPWLKSGRPDPRQWQAGSEAFLQWARHRADFLSLLMADLRRQLRTLESQQQRRIPIQVRVPESTLDINLMEGMDLRRWIKEGWVDEVLLNPLWIWDSDYPDTAKPYLELAKPHGVRVIGGINSTAGKGMKPNARAFLQRLDRQQQEGLDAVALFQTDAMLLVPQLRSMLGPLVKSIQGGKAVGELLAEARLKQPELTLAERFFGLDNHSLMPQLSGSPRLSLQTL